MSSNLLRTPVSTTVLVDLDSAIVRLIFRVYLFVIYLLVGFFGDVCVGHRAQRRLLRTGSVSLPLTTGWFNGITAFTALRSLRQAPAGCLGLLMIFSVILSYASDLAVTTLIQTKSVPSKCVFGIGLVVK